MKELAIRLFIVGKINEWIRKRILEEEIVRKTAKGIDKLQNILNDKVWENIAVFIQNAKEKDNKFIPNFVEAFTEDIFESVFNEIRKSLELRELLENILKEEKEVINI
ncbi:MAG: hypothetical protein KBF12_12790 [Sebaldella sp.]|nr:hypothetical protein [Sebaldella sp.]